MVNSSDADHVGWLGSATKHIGRPANPPTAQVLCGLGVELQRNQPACIAAISSRFGPYSPGATPPASRVIIASMPR